MLALRIRAAAAVVLTAGIGFAGTPASAQGLTFQLGHGLAINTPNHQGALRFAELVNERSGGEITIEVIGGAGLGNEQQLIEGLQLGAVDMAMTVGAGFGTVAPDLNVLGMLYAFRDQAHMKSVMRGEIGERLAESLYDETSIRTVDGSWYFGTRHLTSNRPVETPADLEGMKVRVLPVPIYEAGWRALGAVPTPIAFGDLFTALETNVVDAQENPLPVIQSVGIPLVHKNLTLTGHIVATFAIAMSEDAHSRLSPEQLALITEAAHDAGDYQDQLILDAEASLVDKFRADGMNVIEPDLATFQEKVSTLPDTFEGGRLADLYNAIHSAE
ncbi:TRAP transporter substrate-binding protein [Acuticoccus kandeliae]|uniref:TRAP transporter substrate-binding protein n=1 Tax=Acuticoccus kandeliae TaxID=2073160 RepID=UPI000D3ECD38|nr:TRAP transporter substrate-binding protein [Acuticoccus kandeliae]